MLLTLATVGAVVACTQQLPEAVKRDQQYRFDLALDRCEQGYTAYCKQVANGGDYAH